jgi:hypothetical protein
MQARQKSTLPGVARAPVSRRGIPAQPASAAFALDLDLMENQMLGLNIPSLPKAAILAASLVLTAGATASYADVAQQIEIARGAHVTVQPTTRAQFHSSVPTSTQSGKCVGGYNWTQRSFSVHRTENEMALPVPCR